MHDKIYEGVAFGYSEENVWGRADKPWWTGMAGRPRGTDAGQWRGLDQGSGIVGEQHPYQYVDGVVLEISPQGH